MTSSKMRRVWKGLSWLGAAALLAVLPSAARAEFKVSLTVAGTNITVTDNQPGADLDSGVGSIVIAGTVNNTSYIIAVNSNRLSSPQEPRSQIQDATVDIHNHNSGSESVVIAITDTGFTFPGSSGTPSILQSQLGISSLGGVSTQLTGTFQSFADNTNAEFGKQISTTPQDMVFPLPESEQIHETAFTRGDVYSLTNEFNLTLPGSQELGAAFTGTTRVLAIPAPDNVLLLATSTPIFGLCGWFLRRRRRNAA